MRLLRGKGQVEERLERYAADTTAPAVAAPEVKRPSALARGLDKAVAGSGFAADIATQLARADIKVTVGEYLVGLIIAIVLGGIAAVLIFGSPLFAPLGGAVGFFAPRIYVGMAQGARLDKFNNQLGDTINLMVNGLRAGYSVLQAMEAVSREMPPPIATEFERVVKEVQLGVTIETALGNLLRRITSEDLDMMVTAINVQREVGGNLSEILETISHTIRERVRIKGEIKSLTAQGMATGWVITLIPPGLLIFIFLSNRSYAMRLFEFPCGVAMLVCAGIMIVAGFFVMMKIVQIEV